MTSSETPPPQNNANVADHLGQSGETDSSVMSSESQDSEDSTLKTDDFDTALREYGRSIFESAIDDSHDEDDSHENRIFENEQKVRAQYSAASDELKSQMAVLQDEKRILEVRNSKLEVEISRLHQALQDQEVSSRAACQKLAAEAWEHEVSRNMEVRKRQRVEAEWSDMEQDKKRKAERKAEMWERVEKRRAE